MGFGILFIGYFLLLNFAYFSYTDAIAGVLMLYGLYKLYSINKEFRISAILAGAFTALGIFELALEIADMFVKAPGSELTTSVISILRTCLIGVMTVYMLLGMQNVSSEVRLYALSEICGRLYVLTFPVYGVKLALEILGLFSLDETMPLLILSVISIVLNLTLTVLILIRIYACYMRICMPADKQASEEKKEKGGIIGAFKKHQEEKEREYAEYRFEKFKKKMEKRKGKGKK